MTTSTSTSAKYVPLIGFENDYEIMTQYPYDIRNKHTMKMNYGVNKTQDGIILNLNGKKCLKHRLMAHQFIPNPNNKKLVYHINGDKLDNHLENLSYDHPRKF